MAIKSKPQWVLCALNMFHSAPVGVPPILFDVRCTKDWSTPAQGSFPTAEGASGCPDTCLPSTLASNKGEEPMTDVTSPFVVMYFSQVEALYYIVTCVLKVYGT